jgi:two-component system NtrC family sensor kinase
VPRSVPSSAVPIDGDGAERHLALERDGHKLAASLAHEINNPLQSLLNILYIAQADTALTDEVRQYVMLAREEAHRISEILHAAMHRLRGAEGREDTNLPNLLCSVVDFYRSRLEKRRIVVYTRFCRDGDLAVYSAPLRQTFSNLLLNASDAMPNGGKIYARVAMAHEWSGQKRHGLRVTVADSGGGINANDIARICQPFFTTKGTEGNGIGLSFVKETVQKHGGALRVRSSTRQGHSGSVFTIFLPS